MDSNNENRIPVSKISEFSAPNSAICATAVSLPMTLKHTCENASGMTGFTLPGMMDEPGCTSGRLISFSPQRGPEDISLKSLQSFDPRTAMRRKPDDTRSMELTSVEAFILSTGDCKCICVALRKYRHATRPKFWSAPKPVPSMVPPSRHSRISMA